MALTNQQLLDRIEEIENTINDLQTAMNNLVARRTMQQVIALKQQEIDALKERVTELESQVAILQGS